jgi:hypothetical protein
VKCLCSSAVPLYNFICLDLRCVYLVYFMYFVLNFSLML